MFYFFVTIFFLKFLYAEPIKINLITTNDMHGVINQHKANFINPKYPPIIIGGAGFSKYVDRIRQEIIYTKEGLLILDGGNFFQGSPLGSADKGKIMIEWMNRIGYDGLVLGSYDFIYGSKNINDLSKLANFPFLFSNLNCNNCHLINSNIIPYFIHDISGVKIGVLGIVNSKLSDLTLEDNLSGIMVEKEILAARKWIPQMKIDGAEIIIILSSSGVPWNRDNEYKSFLNRVNSNLIDDKKSLNALEMAYYLDGVDFVVSGGNSKGYNLPWYDPNSHIYLMQGYGGGSEFSHIKLIVDKQSHLFIDYELVVDGRASQTLFSDDFVSNKDDAKWIENKIKNANKIYYSKSNSKSHNTKNPLYLKNNIWEFPNLNIENSIEIMTWNCEFFPNSNDSTILALAEAILDLNTDIIAFQEIRKIGWFSKLMRYLPEYDFIISNHSSFMDLAIIFKNNIFKLTQQIEPFAEDDYNFAGRPPLQANLIYKQNGDSTFLTIINLHMKCCDSGLSRRKKASEMLHQYIDHIYHQHPNIIVLGDWNDDIKDDFGEHCFDPFLFDNRFYFPTQKITYDLNQASYPKEPYVSFLDHILISRNLLPRENPYNVETILIDQFMGGYEIYEAYISDHRPVMLSFSVTK